MTAAKNFRLAVISALPHRANSMNHVLGKKLPTGSGNRVTGCDWAIRRANLPALFRNCGTAGTMNSPTNASAGQEFGVGSVNDCICA